MVAADHIPTIRKALAETLAAQGCRELAERTERGEMDTAPMMTAALAAVDAVLRSVSE